MKYLLTSIKWLYRGLRCSTRWGDVFFEVLRWPRSYWFSIDRRLRFIFPVRGQLIVLHKYLDFRGVARISSEVRGILFAPPPKKTSLNWKFGNVVSLRIFSAYEITLATSEILVAFGWIDWCTSMIYRSYNKASAYFSGFVTLFCYWVRFVVFVLSRYSAWIQIEKVPIWSSLYRFWIPNLKWI